MAIITSVFVGCGSVRKATYPEELVYLAKSEIQTVMSTMAASIHTLDQLLSEPVTDATIRERILTELRALAGIANSLGPGGQSSNHPILFAHLDGFRDQIQVAISGAATEPPDYYPIGVLVGRCNACHARH